MLIVYIIILIFALMSIYFHLEESYKTNPNNPDRIEETPKSKPVVGLNVIQCDNIPQGVSVMLVCDIDSITIMSAGYRKAILHSEILEFRLKPADIVNKSFSVGKATAGVVLLGGLGVLAGMSGKNKRDLKMLSIVYSDNGETKYMQFLQKLGEVRTVKADTHLLTETYKEMMDIINR